MNRYKGYGVVFDESWGSTPNSFPKHQAYEMLYKFSASFNEMYY
jgi:hypothetical protein